MDNMDKMQIETLKDSVEMMLSDDHIERFKAEFLQLCIRMNSLIDFLCNIDTGTAVTHLSPYYIDQLECQLHTMTELFLDYDVRAALDKIDLSGQYHYRWAYRWIHNKYPEDSEEGDDEKR